jgi:hypothetical protein
VRGRNVGHDQVQALGGTGFGRGEVRAELDRAPGARRGELDQPELRAAAVGVEPPAEPAVELFRTVGIRNGDDDHLELRVAAAVFGGTHRGLP